MYDQMKVWPFSDRSRKDTDMDDHGRIKEDREKLQMLLKNLQLFISTSKVLSGYFETRIEEDHHTESFKSCRRRWNFWRIYSTLILIISWADVFRYCASFTRQDGFGPELFLKLFFFMILVACSFSRTVAYVACSCGTVHKTLSDISGLNYSNEGVKKLALYLTLCSVGGVLSFTAILIYHGLIYNGSLIISTYQIEPFATYFKLNNFQRNIATVVSILLTFFVGSGSNISLYMGFIVSYVLRQEFHKIKTEMEQRDTQTKVAFEKLRKRHQRLTEILRHADKFVCPTSGVYIILIVATTTLILYSVCFYTHNDFGIVVTYGSYMVVACTFLAGMSGSAIMINEAVMLTHTFLLQSICIICPALW